VCRELSKDVYCSSLEYGPEHVLMAAGYYLMGTIFYTQVHTLSLYTYL
jgi:hypothetical protein